MEGDFVCVYDDNLILIHNWTMVKNSEVNKNFDIS